MFAVKHPEADFHARLGYVRWLWHLQHGEAPTNEAIAAAVGHTGQWLTGLIKVRTVPSKAADHRTMAEFFGVSRDWLFEAHGAPPRPDLWDAWLEARGMAAHPVAPSASGAGKYRGEAGGVLSGKARETAKPLPRKKRA